VLILMLFMVKLGNVLIKVNAQVKVRLKFYVNGFMEMVK
jgi:hypothetical protein